MSLVIVNPAGISRPVSNGPQIRVREGQRYTLTLGEVGEAL